MDMIAISRDERIKVYKAALSAAKQERSRVDARIAELNAQIQSAPIADHCEWILRKAGLPLHTRVILDALAKHGKAASHTSATRELLQDARFEQVGRHIWAIKEWSDVVKNHRRYGLSVQREPMVTIGDQCEAVLREANRPLPASELPKGPSGSIRSLFEILRGDPQRRFTALGQNTWALSEWPDEMKVRIRPERKAKPVKAKPVTQTGLAIEILQGAGVPLHAYDIAEQAHEAGKPVSGHSIACKLGTDSRKKKPRVENLGGSIWALVEWSEEVKAPYRQKRYAMARREELRK